MKTAINFKRYIKRSDTLLMKEIGFYYDGSMVRQLNIAMDQNIGVWKGVGIKKKKNIGKP